MLNKSRRNKLKLRSTKKKYRQRTKKNYKYGGQGEPRAQEERMRVKSSGKYRFSSDYPTVEIEKIQESIGFEIPTEEGFNSQGDNYKFLEMADRDLTTDMDAKLNKYEISGGVGSQFCKYMYLIRATHRETGNTVLHYVCNRISIEMFQIVFPYYLILYNKDFGELLAYYINKKNKKGQTPLDLLNLSEKSSLYNESLNHSGKWVSVLGMIKNSVTNLGDIKKTAIRWGKRAVNINTFEGKAGFIRGVLEKFGKVGTSAPSGGPSEMSYLKSDDVSLTASTARGSSGSGSLYSQSTDTSALARLDSLSYAPSGSTRGSSSSGSTRGSSRSGSSVGSQSRGDSAFAIMSPDLRSNSSNNNLSSSNSLISSRVNNGQLPGSNIR